MRVTDKGAPIPDGFWPGDENGHPVYPIPHDTFRFRIDKKGFRVRFENESEDSIDIVIENKEARTL